MQSAEAAEDAELDILLSDPALRLPQTPATPTDQKETLSAIGGFQGFQEPIPANSSRHAVPVSASKHNAGEVGPQAGSSSAQNADMSELTDAAEPSAPTSNAEGSTRAGAKARGSWGAPVQPCIAAGKSATSKETAAQLMRNDTFTTNTAVTLGPEDTNQLATAVAEANSQADAGLAESPRRKVTTAEAAATNSATDIQLPQGDMLPEQPTAQQASATSATDRSPAGATSPQQPSAGVGAQQAVATAEAGQKTAVRPAAGSYRRVAWAPLHNPFPAAGATTAAAAAAVEAASASVQPHHLDSHLEVAESASEARPEDASTCSEAEPIVEPAQDSAPQANSGLPQDRSPAQEFAQGPESAQGASEAQNSKDDLAVDAAAAAQQLHLDGMLLHSTLLPRLLHAHYLH